MSTWPQWARPVPARPRSAALIAGTLAPDAGTITIGGHDVVAMDRAERATVAMISQTTHVFDGRCATT